MWWSRGLFAVCLTGFGWELGGVLGVDLRFQGLIMALGGLTVAQSKTPGNARVDYAWESRSEVSGC